MLAFRAAVALGATLLAPSAGALEEACEPSRPRVDALIVDAGLRQSLVAVRSLGRSGLSVAALGATADAPAFRSRWCQAHDVCHEPEGTDDYGDYLDRLLVVAPARVLIPSSDATVALLRRHRAHLERRTRLALASEPALAVAVSKDRTLAIAQRLGIAVPRQVIAHSVRDLPMALREVGLPAVVKPDESWQAGGRCRQVCALVTTVDEARCAVETLTAYGVKALVQQFLTGRREAVSFVYSHGRMHARFAQVAVRTCPPLGGESVLRQSIPLSSASTEQAEELVRTIGLEGYSEVEFRYSASGVPHLMEVNPRLSASVEVAVRAGVDFPRLLYQWARGSRIDAVRTYRAGVWMRNLAGDIMTTCAAFRERGRPTMPGPARAMLDFGLTFLRPMAYDGLDWSDLRPAVAATRSFARNLGRRLSFTIRGRA
jgi:predicted ATP-grasp superfamily ATP-dependent carboligase